MQQRARASSFFRSPRGRRLLAIAAFGGALALAAGLVFLDARPTVRLVNATHHPLVIRIDEGRAARIIDVPPTSTETPDGGVVVRLAPGSHVFHVTTTNGEPPSPVSSTLTTYGNYLFVGASDEQCFFVQRTLYGVASANAGNKGPPSEEALPPEQRLWAIPRTIDAVFSPNPPPLPGDRWSTGGERVALRQRRCESSPPP